MKKIMFLFLLAFAVNSCSISEEPKMQEALLPVESVVMPATYIANDVSTIMVSYRRPTDCHIFNGFHYNVENQTSTIGIRAVIFNQDNCTDDSASVYEAPLEFKPTEAGEYRFKFWTGNDAQGQPLFIEHTVEVQ
ncbi:MAG TPA: hypothetical protein VFQ50_06090 [Flavobacterium sp.]|jgi:hypothetical protein|nr:hypothetical protein [Flavobacterium sp.]